MSSEDLHGDNIRITDTNARAHTNIQQERDRIASMPEETQAVDTKKVPSSSQGGGEVELHST